MSALLAALLLAPALHIGVTDGRTEVRAGDTVRYSIEVRATGSAGVPGLAVSQSVPAGLRILSADRGGVVKNGQVRWTVTLRPGHAERFTTTARVGATPPTTLRLATVACATPPRATVPAVCATHADLLPAGATAIAGTAAPASRSWTVPVTAGIGGLVLLVAVAVLRRRRAG